MSGHTRSSKTATRIKTALALAPIFLLLVMILPSEIALVIWFGAFYLACLEFIPIAQGFAPTAPLSTLRVLVPLATLGGYWLLRPEATIAEAAPIFVLLFTVLVVVTSLAALFHTSDLADGLPGIGILAFAVPYFTLPALAIYRLHLVDIWLVFCLAAIVWLGDTAAFFVGRAFGVRKLASRVSPKKTWAGATASLLAASLAGLIWSLARLGYVDVAFVVVAAITSIAAQLGDLVESLIKRGAGVKDSSHALPGHGGFFDRMDAMIFAAPVFSLGVWLTGFSMFGSDH